MRESRTSGSLGSPGGKPPGATRHPHTRAGGCDGESSSCVGFGRLVDHGMSRFCCGGTDSVGVGTHGEVGRHSAGELRLSMRECLRGVHEGGSTRTGACNSCGREDEKERDPALCHVVHGVGARCMLGGVVDSCSRLSVTREPNVTMRVWSTFERTQVAKIDEVFRAASCPFCQLEAVDCEHQDPSVGNLHLA